MAPSSSGWEPEQVAVRTPRLAGEAGVDCMKYYVYILQSKKDQKYYIGQTSDVLKRLAEHNRGKVRSTKYRMPFGLVYQEECPSRIEAIKREKYFKSYKNTKDLLTHLNVTAITFNPPENIV